MPHLPWTERGAIVPAQGDNLALHGSAIIAGMRSDLLWSGICRVCLGTLLLLLPSCAQKELPRTAAREDPLLSERREKDRLFKRGPGSPIPEKERASFRGLEYYPVDAGLRFQVKLNRYPAPTPIRIGTNTGEIRTALRYGYFEFEVEGKACRLQVYRMEESAGSSGPALFVPFRDATSGTETYAAGRYIDLRENTTGIYDLDFNRAYSPFCAYNEGYSCPVPPAENTLPVPIRAGEKTYPQP